MFKNFVFYFYEALEDGHSIAYAIMYAYNEAKEEKSYYDSLELYEVDYDLVD